MTCELRHRTLERGERSEWRFIRRPAAAMPSHACEEGLAVGIFVLGNVSPVCLHNVSAIQREPKSSRGL